MIRVRKSQLKKHRATNVYARPLKALNASHRVEWGVEGGLPSMFLSVVKLAAEKCRPKVLDSKPVGVWYVIPNRNRQLMYLDPFVSVRVMPKSGTVRILQGKKLNYLEFENQVWDAFNKSGLRTSDCDNVVVKLLKVRDRHRSFHVGPVTPFKIDFYKESCGLTILADGSHPDCVETIEDWPTWVQPLIRAQAAQTQSVTMQIKANEKQTEAITLLTDQIRLHLAVLQGINVGVEKQADVNEKLGEIVNSLYKVMKHKKAEKLSVTGRGQKKITDF